MQYKILHSGCTHDDYSLVPLRKQDLLSIMQWRNSQMDILRQQKRLTAKDQQRYYKNHIRPSYSQVHPRILLLSFLQKGVCIGYGGLTNIDWHARRAELSFLLETKRAKHATTYAKDFSCFLVLIRAIAFAGLHLHRIFTETYDVRPLHVAMLENHGFQFEGRMRDHVRIHKQFVDSVIHGLLHTRDAQK